MPVRHLHHWFNPASIALIGASERPGSQRAALTRNLLAGGFPGELFLINRRHPQIQERPAYRRLVDAPVTPELAIIATPPRTIPRLLLEVGRSGVRTVLIATPCSAFSDAERAALRRSLRQARHLHDLRLLGPGGGLIAPQHGLHAALTPHLPPAGHLALIAQNHGALGPLIASVSRQNAGFSRIAIIGAAHDLNAATLLDWLANDAETRVILLVLETFEHARSLLSAARATTRVKPVLAVFPPQGAEPLARQSDAIQAAALRRAGVLPLPSLRELAQAGALLALEAPVTGKRLLIASNSRLLGRLAADSLRLAGGQLAQFDPPTQQALQALSATDLPPENPLDLGEAADPERYAVATTTLLNLPTTDGLLILHAPNAQIAPIEVETAISAAVTACWEARGEPQPRVLLGWPDTARPDPAHPAFCIPAFETPEAAIQAFLHAWRYQQNRTNLMATPSWLAEPSASVIAAAHQRIRQILAAGRDVLDEAETEALLATYGIALSPPNGKPGPDSLPLALHLVEDAIFGPVLLLEPAGLLAMAWPDPIALLPPLTPTLAYAACQDSSFFQSLQTTGMLSPDALETLWRLLAQTTRLVTDLGEIIEMEWDLSLEPTAGVTVRTAQIRLAATEEPAHARLAIQPYPRELEEQYPLPDGSVLLIRPVRAEDEPTFIEAFAQLSTEEVRMRFMYTFKELSHEDAARFTQIDYGRDMALVVFRQRPGQESPDRCGVARLMRDADDEERAEFAIILLRAATGIGLGPLLVRRLIRYARACGFRELFGEILRENEAMLALSRAMGFSLMVCPEDPGVMIARLPLKP